MEERASAAREYLLDVAVRANDSGKLREGTEYALASIDVSVKALPGDLSHDYPTNCIHYPQH